ncbi:amidohydrolase family protein [Paraglaciecola arctica]|nr:amidohydrolase family protein [Paraglaciecola arctica]
MEDNYMCTYIKSIAILMCFISSSIYAQSTYYQGATVIDGTDNEPIKNATIIVTDGKISCVGSAKTCQISGQKNVINVEGQYITPGLVDAHVHFNQTGWIDGRPDGIAAPEVYPYEKTSMANLANPERWLKSYLCSGITSVFDVGGPFWTTQLHQKFAHSNDVPNIKAVGPLVTWVTVDAMQLNDEVYTFLPMGSIEEAVASVDKVRQSGSDTVKVWFLTPPEDKRDELDARMYAIGKGVKDSGMKLIVHATTLREAKVAIKAGAKMLVHSVDDKPLDQEFLNLLVTNKVYYVPTLLVHGGWTRGYSSVALNLPLPIDDPNGCVDQETLDNITTPERLSSVKPEWLTGVWAFDRLQSSGMQLSQMNENLLKVHNAGGLIATGTDAGNPLTLHGPSIYAEMEAMQNAGLAAKDIIIYSTKNGAGAMGGSSKFGTIEVGKTADFLVLSEDPLKDIRAFRSVKQIVRGGKLHQQSDLAYRNID